MNRCSVCGHDIPRGKEKALGPGVAICYFCECIIKKDEKPLCTRLHRPRRKAKACR